jgi:hypothetical protein
VEASRGKNRPTVWAGAVIRPRCEEYVARVVGSMASKNESSKGPGLISPVLAGLPYPYRSLGSSTGSPFITRNRVAGLSLGNGCCEKSIVVPSDFATVIVRIASASV